MPGVRYAENKEKHHLHHCTVPVHKPYGGLRRNGCAPGHTYTCAHAQPHTYAYAYANANTNTYPYPYAHPGA